MERRGTNLKCGERKVKFKTKWAKGKWASAHGSGVPERITITKLIKLKSRDAPYILIEFDSAWFNITNNSLKWGRATEIKFTNEHGEPNKPPHWSPYNVRIALHKNRYDFQPWKRNPKWDQERYNGFIKIAKRLLPFVVVIKKVIVYSPSDPCLLKSKLK